jgi:hypothetical protein
MTKEQLLPLAKVYFNHNKGLLSIYGTEDKHFFYEEIHAIRHCGKEKKFFMFTQEDFVVEKPKAKQKPKQKVEEESSSPQKMQSNPKDAPKKEE